MKIAIVGAGNVGATLGKAWAGKGHEVVYAARSPDSPRVRAALSACGAKARSDTAANAVAAAEVVLLAVPGSEAESVVKGLALGGKVLLDATNPLTADVSGLTVGHSDSAGERVARAAKDAKVVKVFNSTGAGNMANPGYRDGAATMFYAGDDAQAKQIAAKLAADCGLDAVDAGPLKNARLLEPLAMLWIHLAYAAGMGPDMAFRLMRR
jgi:8-hydroxy-5-deazaflavin:NADPH oxidoreductase